MVNHLLPTKQYYCMGNHRLPARGNRTWQSIDEAGFARWKYDWSRDEKLADGGPVKILDQDITVVQPPTPPWGLYDGIGEYLPPNYPSDPFDKSNRRYDVWCLLDYTIVRTGNDINWPLLQALTPDGINIMSLRPGIGMIRDQQTGPFYYTLGFGNELDVWRNKILVNMFYFTANMKAISVMAYDHTSSTYIGMTYPAWDAAVVGAGTWLPLFGVNPREGYSHSYIVINDFQVSDTAIPYGSPVF